MFMCSRNEWMSNANWRKRTILVQISAFGAAAKAKLAHNNKNWVKKLWKEYLDSDENFVRKRFKN